MEKGASKIKSKREPRNIFILHPSVSSRRERPFDSTACSAAGSANNVNARKKRSEHGPQEAKRLISRTFQALGYTFGAQQLQAYTGRHHRCFRPRCAYWGVSHRGPCYKHVPGFDSPHGKGAPFPVSNPFKKARFFPPFFVGCASSPPPLTCARSAPARSAE